MLKPRWLAVAAFALAPPARADVIVTKSPVSSATIKSMMADKVVFSVRNTGPDTITIDHIANAGSKPICAYYDGDATAYPQMTTTSPVDIASGQQQQFYVGTNGIPSVDFGGCVFVMTMNNVDPQNITVSFVSSSGGVAIDAQPQLFDFGEQATFEDQYLFLSNVDASTQIPPLASITGDGTFTFQTPPCVGATTCAVPSIGVSSFAAVKLRCQPKTVGLSSAQLDLGSMTPIDLHCTGVTGNGNGGDAGVGGGDGGTDGGDDGPGGHRPPSSFYACSSGRPTHAWPIVAALVAIPRRKRR